MVHCHLVHGNIHYRAIRPMAVVPREIRLTDRRGVAVRSTSNTPGVLLFHFFVGLENWWQQTLVLHERAIMMVPFCTTSRSDRPANIILEITVKSLMLAVFNL